MTLSMKWLGSNYEMLLDLRSKAVSRVSQYPNFLQEKMSASLTHWILDKIDAISQTTFSGALS